MHLNNLLLFRHYIKDHIQPSMKVVEVGASAFPTDFYQELPDHPEAHWQTLTVDFDLAEKAYTLDQNAHIVAKDGYHYPIEAEAYDVVLSSNVIEHVPDHYAWFAELKRITKPGGLIITMGPLSYPYHEDPVDCWRVYPDGLKVILDHFELEPLVNTFASLEKALLPDYIPTIPGRSIYNNKGMRRFKAHLWWNRIIRKLPGVSVMAIPFEVSYDLVCVARKSQQA